MKTKNLIYKMRYICILFCMSLISNKVFCQVLINFSNPNTINATGYFNQLYKENEIILPHLDSSEIKNIADEDVKYGGANKFAEPIKYNVDIENVITWLTVQKITYGRINFNSKNAKSLNINFGNFFLPESAKMFIYNKNGKMICGPITSKENNLFKTWRSPTLKGEDLSIEIRILSSELKQLNLVISEFSFGYTETFKTVSRNYGQSDVCNVDILCPEGLGWEKERNSVGLTQIQGSRWCSGALINNSNNSDIPYFLTANHCSTANFNDWQFYFHYWSPTCQGGDGNYTLYVSGATLKANWDGSDFLLLQLNQPPANPFAEVFYSGWTRLTNNITSTTLIHHPKGDVMKISKDYNSPIQLNVTCGTHNADCWEIDLNIGSTDGGSSGCPYYNQDHKIFAQHFCGIAPNNDDNYDCVHNEQQKWGGRFDLSWNGGGTNNTRLSNWLDPQNLGFLTMNGRCGATPDLIILNQSIIPTSVTAGQTVNVSFIERNIGTTTATPNYVSFHLSSDNVLTPGQNGDIYLDEHFVNQSLVANQQTSLLTENILIPSSLATGTYYLFYSADGNQTVNECDELNNFATVLLNVTGIPQYADLIVQNASVSPSAILPGGQATASCKNKNQGTVTAGASFTALWLSQDQVYNGSPTDINLNADISIPSLAPGQISSLLSHSITIPSGTACGQWYIMFGADATNMVPEGSNETNNQVFIPITVACELMCNNDYSCGPPAPPFLSIATSCVNTSCSTVGAHPPSQDIPFSCGGNQYQAARYDDDVWFKITPSTSSQITITVDPTSNGNNFDPVIGLYSGACLTPTQVGCADDHPGGYTEQLVYTPTAGTTYLIRVFGYGIGSAYSGNFDICVTTIGAPDPADLIIVNPSLSVTNLCPDEVTIASYNIQNVGGTNAPASTVKYYLSSNNTYSGNDVLLGSTSVASLNIGQSLSKTKSLTIPTGTSAGTWYILIIADANNNVTEGSAGEANNVSAVPITVTTCNGVADLIINYISSTPSTINPGTRVHVTFESVNIGNGYAPYCRIGIYRSTDNNFNAATDEYIDDWNQNALDPGETIQNTLFFDIPDCNPCGSFYIFLVVDYQHIINESNEDNNDDSFSALVTGCTPCIYSVPSSGINFGASGGTGLFAVTTTQCCPWTATTSNNWITLINSTGTGTGNVSYSVSSCNGGGTRMGTILVNGQSHQITQNCTESCNASQTFLWAVQAGSPTLSDASVALASDATGNLYMTGRIQGVSNFGNGIVLTTPSTAPDVFVSKHNSSGQIQWATNYGTTLQESGSGIATDSDGNIYVIGNFKNTITFGSITLTANNPNEGAAFITKLNSSGVVQWAKKINSVYSGSANEIVIVSNNNIYVTGDLSDYVGNAGSGIYIAKYNTSGTQLSYSTYGFGIYTKSSYGIAVDNAENIFICGRYLQTITLGAFTLTVTNILDIDGFIAKVNSSGTVIWAKKVYSPGQGQDDLVSVAVDASNFIYAVGHVDSTAIIGNITIPLPNMESKAIIIKYNQDGTPVWAKASVSGFQANKKRIVLGNDNDLYFCGSFSTSMHIDSFQLTSNGSSDAFMIRIDPNAKIIWMKGFGGPLDDAAYGLLTNTSNDVLVSGDFRGTVAFDNTVLTSYGSGDIYLAKFKQCDPPPASITFTGPAVICPGQTLTLSTSYCSTNEYQWKLNNINIPGANNPIYIATESGIYKVNVAAYPGCETLSSPVTINNHGYYTFIGTGNWDIPSNWTNNTMPPPIIQDCYDIIIDHLPGGECILNIHQTLLPQSKIIVNTNKSLRVLGDIH